MSNQTKDGGPAFPLAEQQGQIRDPVTGEWGSGWQPPQDGMTLRDWFAGQALAALPHVGCGADLNNQDFASAAYQLADAMLAEREKRNAST